MVGERITLRAEGTRSLKAQAWSAQCIPPFRVLGHSMLSLKGILASSVSQRVVMLPESVMVVKGSTGVALMVAQLSSSSTCAKVNIVDAMCVCVRACGVCERGREGEERQWQGDGVGWGGPHDGPVSSSCGLDEKPKQTDTRLALNAWAA